MPTLSTLDTQGLNKQLAEMQKKQNKFAKASAMGASFGQNIGGPVTNPYSSKIKDLEKQMAGTTAANEQRQLVEAMINERPDRAGVGEIAEFQKIRDLAFGGGSNPYYDAQREKAKLEQGFAIDDLSASNLGQMQNAYSQLAQSGGLSSGSRERIAADSVAAGLKGRQGLRAQGMKTMADLGIAEEGTRADQQAQVTNQLVTDQSGQNAYNMDTWNRNNEMRMAQIKSEEERRLADQNKPSCFKGDTLILMADGTLKPVSLVEVGEKTSGGVVYSKSTSLAHPAQWVYFHGVFLTKRHAVLEFGKWVRAESSENCIGAIVADRLCYNLATEKHFLEVGPNKIMVSDMHETSNGDSVGDEESLRIKNAKGASDAV